MGSSCSSGQSKKDKEGKCKRSKKGKKGSDKSPRGSTASNSSLYVYQKAPTPPPEGPPPPDGSAGEQGDTQPLLAAEEKQHPPAERNDSQPLSPTSPNQVTESPKDDGLPAFAEFPEVGRALLVGDVKGTLPQLKPRKIVIFLCADHEDTIAERIVLMERVFKKLREHCVTRGYELEFVDLHWGFSAKGPEDPSLRELCLQELHTYNTHAHLIPMVFLNETLGPLILPQKLSPDTWEHLQGAIGSDEEKQILQDWYHLDENARPPVYKRVPISNWDDDATDKEKLLLELMQQHLTPDQAAQSLSTYLEDLVKQVMSLSEKTLKRCFWISRKFIQRIEARSSMDEMLQPRLEALQSVLQQQVDEGKMLRYTIHWSEGKVDPDQVPEHAQYAEDLCAQIQILALETLNSVMDKAETESPDSGFLGMERRLFQELAHQSVECQNLGQQFFGLEELIESIGSYVKGSTNAPLIIHGPIGCGKTALVAKIVCRCNEWLPKAPVVFRFTGLTPDSATTEQILRSVCEQCCLLYGIHPSLASQNVSRLSKQLPSLLEKVSISRPLIVLIDGLDQVQSYGSISLGWIPTVLPDHVKLILTLRDATPQIQEIKALISDAACFMEMPSLTGDVNMQIVQSKLQNEGRALTESQEKAIQSSVAQCPLPLYAVIVAGQARFWASDLDEPVLTHDPDNQIAKTFQELEAVYGSTTVCQVLGYLTATKQGILDSEMTDLLSCDNVSIKSTSAAAADAQGERCFRSSPALWLSVRDRLKQFVRTVLVGQLGVTRWWDASFRAAAEEKYLSGEHLSKISSLLVDYYQGVWAEKQHGKHGSGKEVDCLLLAQPLKFEHAYNRRKLDELPLHLCRSGQDMSAVMPWDSEWLFAKVCGSDVYQLLEDFTLMTESPDLHLLKELLEVSAYALAYDGLQLYSQIVGRLSAPDAAQHPLLSALFELASSAPIPSLLPLEVCLHPIGTPSDSENDGEIYFDSMHFLKNSLTHVVSLGGDQGELVVWNVYDQSAVRTLKGVQQPRDIRMVDECRGLVLCNRELKLYNLDEAAFEVKLKGVMMNQKMPFYGLHDSDHVVFLSRNRMYVNMTTLQTGDCVANFKVGEDRFLNSLLVSANGKMCVCGDEVQKPFPLLVWDLDSRKLVYDLRIPHHEFITRLSAITNDGHYVVSACKEVDFPSPNFIIVYDLQNGTLFKKWKPEVNTCSIAISSEGCCVVCGLENTKILVWDLVTGACRFSLKGHCAPPDRIQIDDGGGVGVTFDSTGRDRSIRLWNFTKGFAIAVFTPDAYVKCFELSPDGNAVVLGLQGRSNPLTLVLCNQQTVADVVPQVPSFGDTNNTNKIVDVSASG